MVSEMKRSDIHFRTTEEAADAYWDAIQKAAQAAKADEKTIDGLKKKLKDADEAKAKAEKAKAEAEKKAKEADEAKAKLQKELDEAKKTSPAAATVNVKELMENPLLLDAEKATLLAETVKSQEAQKVIADILEQVSKRGAIIASAV